MEIITMILVVISMALKSKAAVYFSLAVIKAAKLFGVLDPVTAGWLTVACYVLLSLLAAD